MNTKPDMENTNRRPWALQRLGRLVRVNLLLCLAFPLLAQTERVSLTLLGQWLGNTNAIVRDLAMSGDVVCLAVDSGLIVIDVSDPTEPRPVSQYPESPSSIPGIAMSGQYAYLAMPDRLQILDLSNPAQPVPVGAYTNGDATGVAVEGSKAYVVGRTTFTILDTVDPANPTLVGQCPVRDHAFAVATAGRVACVLSWIDNDNDDYSMLTVIDLTDPAHPVPRGTLHCGHTGVSILGYFAYLTDWNEDFAGWIVDLTDLDQPRRVAWSDGLYAAIDGHYAFATDEGLHVLDIANPAQPLWRTSAKSFDGHVAVSGDRVCVAGDASMNLALQVFQVSRTRLAEIALEVWTNQFDGPENLDDEPRVVAVDGNGDVVVTGSAGSDDSGASRGDIYTAKYAGTDGRLLWERQYNGAADLNDFPVALALDAAGNAVVTGASQTSNSWDAYTAKYAAADGRVLWEQRYQAVTNVLQLSGQSVAIDPQGNAVVTGQYYGPDRTPQYRAKYAAADGAILWQHERDQIGGSLGAVAVDAQGNAFIAGDAACPPGSGGVCLYVAKYTAATGALLWEQYHSGRGHPDYGSISLDQEGNLVMNVLFDADEGVRTYTAKCAGKNGSVLWERTGGPHVEGYPPLLDSAGNVVIVGDGGFCDLVKYAAADGTTLWEQRINVPAGDSISALGAAIDAVGDVIVGGGATGPNGPAFWTLKYCGSDGTPLWEKRCDLGVWACAVAVDAHGDIVATGAGLDGGGQFDFLTVKYVAVPAAVLNSPQPSVDGMMLSFAAKPGLTYALDRAGSLTSGWTRLGTALVEINGVGSLLDPQPPPNHAFYRVVFPEPMP